ncbi:hypothetical protein FE257_007020 [Aspergillus nanangensis]|uniref:DJ-1/PfpI domain-containing protein n=1 Tax=Aspergillus nanangensis TaxID=2582783 RepID=A0AAD4CNC7_ASPNN|nr:hypothetical protein FE257_007020 [Aspergillus nanangensis]
MAIKQSALVLIYPNFNSLETTGPLEVFFNTGISATIAAATDLTTSQENVTLQRAISLDDAQAHLSDYDILVVPGSRSRNILPYLPQPPQPPQPIQTLSPPADSTDGDNDDTEHAFSALLDLIETFASLPPRPGTTERAILSGTLGAYLLGAAGVLDGRVATTHRLVLGTLRQVCADAQRGRQPTGCRGTEVVPRSYSAKETRWYVDAGCNEAGVRVFTVCGPSAVIDATLYLMSLWRGRLVAEEAAMFLGHTWREI